MLRACTVYASVFMHIRHEEHHQSIHQAGEGALTNLNLGDTAQNVDFKDG